MREWLDQRSLIPFASVTNFSGIGAVGKTLLMLQLCISCATGMPWLSAAIRKGPALFYSAEEPIEEMHIRCDEICEAENIHLDVIRGFTIIDLSQEENATLIKGDNRTGMAGPTDLFHRLELNIDPEAGRRDPRQSWADRHRQRERSDYRCHGDALAAVACRQAPVRHRPALPSHPTPARAKVRAHLARPLGSLLAARRSTWSGRRQRTARSPTRRPRVLTSQKTNYARRGTIVNLRWEFNRFICTDKPHGCGD